MKKEIREIIEKAGPIYINVHKDNIIRDTAKSIVVDLGNNQSVYIAKSDMVKKEEYFNYVKLFINKKNLYSLTTTEFSDKKWYEDGIEIYFKLLNSNYKQNQYSKILNDIKSIQ